MGFLVFLPAFLAVIAALIWIVIAFLCFIGICLIVIGITGIAMNKIYLKQMKSEKNVSIIFHNTSSIILGLIFILFPFGYLLFVIIKECLKLI